MCVSAGQASCAGPPTTLRHGSIRGTCSSPNLAASRYFGTSSGAPRRVVSTAHTIRHHIRTDDVPAHLNIKPFTYYYNNRIPGWGGHVARMDMSRLPRMFLTAWVNHRRPVGCPQMTFGRTLNKALAAKGIPKAFSEWSVLAQDRDEWTDLFRSPSI